MNILSHNNNDKDSSKVLEYAIVLSVVGAFFVLYTFAIGDGDIFWHIKTGEYIVKFKALPQVDTFAYTSIDQSTPTSKLAIAILKQYWLAQIILYYIWSAGGAVGIILLRAFIYSALIFSVYVIARKKSNFLVAFGIFILIGTYLPNFSNDRPQLFSYPLTLIVLYLLEKIISDTKPFPAGYFLPIIMLLWSNMHGAYMLGDLLISIYFVSYLFKSYYDKEKICYAIPIVLLLSLICSLVNPTGISGFNEIIKFFSDSKPNYITEYYSPYYILINYNKYNVSYWICIFIYIAVLFISFKKMSLHHILLLLFITVLSLSAYRHTPYALIMMPIVANYFIKVNKKALLVIITAGIVVFVSTTSFSDSLQFKADSFFPSNSSQILKEAKPDGRIFNHMSWGGYLMINNPEYPVFIDGRAMSNRINSRYIMALNGVRWDDIFANYNINTVLVPILVLNESTPLIAKLLQNDNWDVLFYAYNEVILIKKTPHNMELIKKYGSKKTEFIAQLRRLKVYDTLI
jgi:hypothetical protein